MSISKYEIKKRLGKVVGTTTVEKYKGEIDAYLDQIRGVEDKLAFEMVQNYIVKKFMNKQNGLQKTK